MNAVLKLKQPHEILRDYLLRKQSKNKAYSLRALARDMGHSPSFVSQIFSGKRRINDEVFQLLVDALEIDEMGRRQLSMALLYDSELPAKAKKDIEASVGSPSAQKEYARYQESHLPEFDLLRNWYAIAILDLISLENFKPEIPWIAKKLKISNYQVETAIQNLKNSGLLVIEDGVWKKSKSMLNFSTKTAKDSVRMFHKQMIEKALNELMTKSSQEAFDRRMITGLLVASNPKNVAKAKARIDEMIFEISEILSEGECTEIYQLNAQLFALTEGED